MKILTVDIGTGTQDILLFDTRLDVENSIKLVLPSPTMIVHNQLKRATKIRKPVLLSGVTMGGGPAQWAAEAHIQAGLPIFATPAAARSFNDDLNVISDMGIRIVSKDETLQLPADVERIELKDFDFELLHKALSLYGLDINGISALAIAVFDHGAAPPDISDRKFRFDYLRERISSNNRLSAFAYLRNDIPSIMTRFQAVAKSVENLDIPLVVMDTAPAAILGATFDPMFRKSDKVMLTNIGNFHTIAFRLSPNGIEGVFEHHTGMLTRLKLEELLHALANGALRNEDVFNDNGHGALVVSKNPINQLLCPGCLIVTGPRRSMLYTSQLRPHFAAPFGDMMLAGCYGLLAAIADKVPELTDNILTTMNNGKGTEHAPWDL